ncbi:MAG: acetyl-CoA carboxylase [Candidatus Limnocylindrales bacterium]
MDEQPTPLPEQAPDQASEQTAEGAALAGDVGADEAQLPATDEAAELIVLIDRLEGFLERSGLAELEVGSGGMTIVLRSAAAVRQAPPVSTPAAPGSIADDGHAPATVATESEPSHHVVVAPLTGLYYTAPSPDAAPYVRVGAQVVVGQVIGLIEAMKLYNEIKSDVAGRVVRLAAENGKLVKAKQALIEVEPS